MLVILEWRHRLSHMRGSLERKWSQPRRHSMYIGPPFNSRMRNQEGKTSWPQIWESVSFEQDRFRYCASAAQIWLQTSIVEAQRNERWHSSSSSWWSWQGPWWTPCSYESHHGDDQSTDWTRRLVIQVFGTILQGLIFLNSFTLWQMDRLQLTAVYCNRRGV